MGNDGAKCRWKHRSSWLSGCASRPREARRYYGTVMDKAGSRSSIPILDMT
jgi:hypothetical protein